MRALLKIGIASVVFGYFAACSPVQFEKLPDPGCGTGCVTTTTSPGKKKYSQEKTIGEGLVDILIINDNSGSMSFEQSKMADRFPTFLQSLGSMDYRIAMTTTDISSNFSSTPVGVKNYPSAANGNGAFQDGNLLAFGSAKYLDRSTPSKESLFNSVIKRNETIVCEQSGYQTCPSGDERGIFAANLVLDRTASEFMRPLAHLAVIILSDEDERGLSDPRSVRDQNDQSLLSLYPLENYDKPETLISRFKQRFPEKTLSVHSIIVPPRENDANSDACLAQQSGQTSNPNQPGNPFVRGTVGYSYAKASTLTGGKIGTICASDYGAQLTDIGYYLQGQVTSMPFNCRPVNDTFTLKDQTGRDLSATPDFDKLEVKINEKLGPNTKITLEYECLDQ